MKNIIYMAVAFLAATQVSAAEVLDAKIDAAGENIEVTVSYGGGCFEHQFKLQMGGCLESYPVQCAAKVVDVTKEVDICEAIIMKKVTFNLKAHGLDKSYYANGSLTLSGDGGTSASVIIPDASKKPVKENVVRCETHTGSLLTINKDKKTIDIVAIGGEKLSLLIVGSQYRSIETFPAIEQITYKLDDGRSVRTEFIIGDNVGTGNYIRLNGDFSPEFECRK